jgi:NADP-dependent 3-hydroxy acid dehydrogenase YdfG
METPVVTAIQTSYNDSANGTHKTATYRLVETGYRVLITALSEENLKYVKERIQEGDRRWKGCTLNIEQRETTRN